MTTKHGSLVIKGVRDGLLVHLNPDEDWPVLVRELITYIDQQGDFFKGGRLALDVGLRPVRKHDLSALQTMLEKRGVTLWAVLGDSMTTLAAVRKLGLQTSLTPPAAAVPAAEVAENSADAAVAVAPTLLRVEEETPGPPPIDSEETGTAGVLVRRTLRSGRTVRHTGHVVVLGDVNPGAEVIAGGDVIVWGRLRGVVHAGAHGDETAMVCALDMIPTQLRIAGHIATSPDDKRRKPRPETALVRDGQIIVEAWQ